MSRSLGFHAVSCSEGRPSPCFAAAREIPKDRTRVADDEAEDVGVVHDRREESHQFVSIPVLDTESQRDLVALRSSGQLQPVDHARVTHE